jgi:U6 snRNA-associated Sm-like protein LSm6
MENGMAAQGEGRDPSGFLSEIIGSAVTVKLNSGVVYKGLSRFRVEEATVLILS